MPPKDRLSEIQAQFTRQGEAYKKLDYVREAEGLTRVVKMTRIERQDCVLDVACGPGFLTIAFAEACKEAVGIDATEAFRSHAAQGKKRTTKGGGLI